MTLFSLRVSLGFILFCLLPFLFPAGLFLFCFQARPALAYGTLGPHLHPQGHPLLPCRAHHPGEGCSWLPSARSDDPPEAQAGGDWESQRDLRGADRSSWWQISPGSVRGPCLSSVLYLIRGQKQLQKRCWLKKNICNIRTVSFSFIWGPYWWLRPGLLALKNCLQDMGEELVNIWIFQLQNTCSQE